MSSAVNKSSRRRGAGAPIAFRFQSAKEQRAFERLASLRGTTPGLLARALVQAALHASDTGEVVVPILSRELGELRRALGNALLVLFVKTAEIEQREAIAWFEKNWPTDQSGRER